MLHDVGVDVIIVVVIVVVVAGVAVVHGFSNLISHLHHVLSHSCLCLLLNVVIYIVATVVDVVGVVDVMVAIVVVVMPDHL